MKFWKWISKLNPLPLLRQLAFPLKTALEFDGGAGTPPNLEVYAIWDHNTCGYTSAIALETSDKGFTSLVLQEPRRADESVRALCYRTALKAAEKQRQMREADVYTEMAFC